MTMRLIGTRIKALREEHRLSQDDFAHLLGFKDRQTVSAIETGTRRVTADELVLAVEKLRAPLDYFTVPARWRRPLLVAADRRRSGTAR